jgi:hypothetical protein
MNFSETPEADALPAVTGLSTDAPTLGEIYEILKPLKDAGVTLESLMYVAKTKVWWEDD